MSEEGDLSPYERHLVVSLERAVERLCRDQQLEVDEARRPALVAELLAAAGNAETHHRMLKKVVRTLVDSENVEEVYASDDELREVIRASIGQT